jgi:PAS domain S-box-containing protein
MLLVASEAPDGLPGYTTVDSRIEPPEVHIERLQAALSNAGVGTWDLDPISGAAHFDPTTRLLFGIEPDEQISSQLWRYKLVHPDDRDFVISHMRDALKPEIGLVNMEFRAVNPRDGSIRRLATKGSTQFEGGRPIRLVGIMRDVSQTYLDQQNLRDLAAKFRAITDSMPQIVWSTLPDGYHDFYNQQWYDFTGVPAGSTDGEGWNAIFHPEDQPRAWERWRHSLATGDPYEIEYRLRRRDGVYRWTLGRALAVRDEQGRITRWFGTCTDIDDQVQARDQQRRFREALDAEVKVRTAELTNINRRLEAEIAERERVEAALRQSQKMEAIGQLTGGIAHDFNNILTGIIGNLQLLSGRLAANAPDLERYSSAALTSAHRAASLTQRLLAFSKRQTLHATVVDANELIGSMEELLGRTLGEQITLKTQLTAALPPVMADANQLESALLNLAINARDAMPEGGTLTLSTTPAPDWPSSGGAGGIRISVRDTGGGMSPDVLARAFDPFFTTKPIGEGTGLGLSMVYGFAQQSGGTASIQSSPDSGTAVHIDLPVAGLAEGVTAASLAVPAPAPATATLLLVEDDVTVLALMAEVVRELGYTVLEAHDEASALPFLASNRTIDLLVSDVGLPGTNGRQLAERARQFRPDLKVLFVTGYARDARSKAEFLGENMDMLSKPFALDALIDKVQRMLG